MLAVMRRFVLLGCVVAVTASKAHARGAKNYTITEAFEAAPVSILGKITRAEAGEKNCFYKIVIKTSKVLKGNAPDSFSVCFPAMESEGNYDIRLDREAFFFLKPGGKGRIIAADDGAWVSYIEEHQGERYAIPSGRLTETFTAQAKPSDLPPARGAKMTDLLAQFGK